jgi:hypothetical protein
MFKRIEPLNGTRWPGSTRISWFVLQPGQAKWPYGFRLAPGRLQLVGQLLMESCLLAVFGGVVWLLVAQWTLNLVASLLPAQVTTVFRLGVDVPVLLFAGALTFGTAMLFGHSGAADKGVRFAYGFGCGARTCSPDDITQG